MWAEWRTSSRGAPARGGSSGRRRRFRRRRRAAHAPVIPRRAPPRSQAGVTLHAASALRLQARAGSLSAGRDTGDHPAAATAPPLSKLTRVHIAEAGNARRRLPPGRISRVVGLPPARLAAPSRAKGVERRQWRSNQNPVQLREGCRLGSITDSSARHCGKPRWDARSASRRHAEGAAAAASSCAGALATAIHSTAPCSAPRSSALHVPARFWEFCGRLKRLDNARMAEAPREAPRPVPGITLLPPDLLGSSGRRGLHSRARRRRRRSLAALCSFDAACPCPCPASPQAKWRRR